MEDVVPKGLTHADLIMPHPYLSFVHDPELTGDRMRVNERGMAGRDWPERKEEGTFVILLTGGSVAAQLAGLVPEKNILEEALNQHYKSEGIKRFIVLNGGGPAWHQPQQFILFALYAHLLDGVITLDGVNEMTNMNGISKSLGYGFEQPPDHYFAAIEKEGGGLKSMWPLRLDGALLRFQREVWLFRHSRLSYLVTNGVRRWARGIYARGEAGGTKSLRKKTTLFFAPPGGMEPDEGVLLDFDMYKKYIRMMHAIGTRLNVKTLFALQPVPAIGKDLSEEEMKTVGTITRERALGYLIVANSMELLRIEEKIPVYGLAGVFRDHRETLYTDAVHLNDSGLSILRDSILNLLEINWGLVRN
ncbi:MAG: hypothetical protein HYY14_07105 [Candidatus Omnitrophica bacterium]|nr:hypothetical protein [Candidatus Omnitrophota bacterium]